MGALVNFLFAQNIPNRDFENWYIDTLYENTNEWETPFDEFFSPEILTIEKSVDAENGNLSVKLSNDTIWNEDDMQLDSTFGYVIQGMFGDNGPESGVVYTTDFDSITGWYKNEMVGNDSAIIVISKFSTTDTTFDAFTIGGVNATWTRFSFPVSAVSGALEEVLVAFVSTDADIIDNGIIFNPNSWIMFDNVAFTHPTTTPDPIPDNSFEDWYAESFEDAENWWSFNYYSHLAGENLQVTKTTDAYSGDYAMRITTEHIVLEVDDTIGVVSNSQIGDTLPGGFAFDEVPTSVSGYYKYNPATSADTAAVIVALSKWNSDSNYTEEVDLQFFQLVEAANYTQFHFDIDTSGLDTTMFDSVNILFVSSQYSFDGGAPLGSELFIDELWLDSKCAFADTTELWATLDTNIVEGGDVPMFNFYGPEGYSDYVWSEGQSFNEDSSITLDRNDTIVLGLSVTTVDNCVISDTITLYVEWFGSVNDNIKSLISVFPNPATSTIFIDLTQTEQSLEKEITISDLLGNQILSTFVQAESKRINISEYPVGVYLLKIRIGEELATYKVVKK